MSSFETIDNPGGSSVKSTSLQFDESKFKLRSRAILGEPQIPGMIRFLVGRRIVKTETQAITVLLIVAVLIIVASVFIFKGQGVQPTRLDPTLQQFNS